MTVKELIEKLEQYPDKFKVVAETFDENDRTLVSLEYCPEENKVIILID